MPLTTIAVVVIVYLVLMFLLNRLFEKFFKIMFFLITALFIVGLIYIMTKGV